ncbi:hypothetical protein SAMN05443245_5006 [Paraburkholderia fungorum]|uniref:Uncharacterized protein n=1 Tax=Paraburkholderia fungorum TaxID=134537 RepID=A0A1H1ICZ4_9BURK|nr:hypothetical protein SAMN05443245_5006 [Paraburkholderia fungorum]
MAGVSITSISIRAVMCIALRFNAIFAACSSARKRRFNDGLPEESSGRAPMGFKLVGQWRNAYQRKPRRA